MEYSKGKLVLLSILALLLFIPSALAVDCDMAADFTQTANNDTCDNIYVNGYTWDANGYNLTVANTILINGSGTFNSGEGVINATRMESATGSTFQGESATHYIGYDYTGSDYATDVDTGATWNAGSGDYYTGTWYLNSEVTFSSGNTYTTTRRSGDIAMAIVGGSSPNANGGTVHFINGNNQNIYSSPSDIYFHNLIINKSAGTVRYYKGEGADTHIAGNLTIVEGSWTSSESDGDPSWPVNVNQTVRVEDGGTFYGGADVTHTLNSLIIESGGSYSATTGTTIVDYALDLETYIIESEDGAELGHNSGIFNISSSIAGKTIFENGTFGFSTLNLLSGESIGLGNDNVDIIEQLQINSGAELYTNGFDLDMRNDDIYVYGTFNAESNEIRAYDFYIYNGGHYNATTGDTWVYNEMSCASGCDFDHNDGRVINLQDISNWVDFSTLANAFYDIRAIQNFIMSNNTLWAVNSIFTEASGTWLMNENATLILGNSSKSGSIDGQDNDDFQINLSYDNYIIAADDSYPVKLLQQNITADTGGSGYLHLYSVNVSTDFDVGGGNTGGLKIYNNSEFQSNLWTRNQNSVYVYTNMSFGSWKVAFNSDLYLNDNIITLTSEYDGNIIRNSGNIDYGTSTVILSPDTDTQLLGGEFYNLNVSAAQNISLSQNNNVTNNFHLISGILSDSSSGDLFVVGGNTTVHSGATYDFDSETVNTTFNDNLEVEAGSFFYPNADHIFAYGNIDFGDGETDYQFNTETWIFNATSDKNLNFTNATLNTTNLYQSDYYFISDANMENLYLDSGVTAFANAGVIVTYCYLTGDGTTGGAGDFQLDPECRITAPTQVSPVNQLINWFKGINFIWTAVDGAYNYIIYVYDVAGALVYSNETISNETTSLNVTNDTYDWDEGVYSWEIYSNDTQSISESSGNVSFKIDVTDVEITYYTPTELSVSTYVDNITMNIDVNDSNLYGTNATIWNSTGTQMFFEEYTNLAGVNYTWDNNTGSLAPDTYDIEVCGSDDHTIKELSDKDKAKKLTYGFSYNIGETEIDIEITSKEKDNIKYSSTTKLVDRFTEYWEFNYDPTKKQSITYTVSSSDPMVYRPNSPYNAHFVTGSAWVDFELLNDTDVIYNIKQIDSYTYEVTLDLPKGKDTLTFKSIGGVNVDCDSAQFIINSPPTIDVPNIYTGSGTNYTNETIYCNSSINDTDAGQTLTMNTTFYENGIIYYSSLENCNTGENCIETLSSALTSKNNTYSCEVWATDGYENTAYFNSTDNISIINSYPTNVSIIYPVDTTMVNNQTEPIPFNWTDSTDLDGDQVNYTFVIDNNAGFTSPVNYTTGLSSSNFDLTGNDQLPINNWYYWKVWSSTEDGNSTEASGSFYWIEFGVYCVEVHINVTNPTNDSRYPYSINIPLEFTQTGGDVCYYEISGVSGQTTIPCSDNMFSVDFDDDYNITVTAVKTSTGGYCDQIINFEVDRSQVSDAKGSLMIGLIFGLILIAVMFILFGTQLEAMFKPLVWFVAWVFIFIDFNLIKLLVMEYIKVPAIENLLTTTYSVLLYSTIIIGFLIGLMFVVNLLKKMGKTKSDRGDLEKW